MESRITEHADEPSSSEEAGMAEAPTARVGESDGERAVEALTNEVAELRLQLLKAQQAMSHAQVAEAEGILHKEMPIAPAGSSQSLKGIHVVWPMFQGAVGEDARRFLSSFQLAAMTAQVYSDSARMVVIMGSQCLRGVALSWYLAMAAAAGGPANLAGSISWPEFEARFVAKWCSPLDDVMARRRRDTLYQGGSVEDYISEFVEVDARLLDDAPAARLHAFVAHLKPEISRFVLLSGASDLDQAMRVARNFAASESQQVSKPQLARTSVNMTELLAEEAEPTAKEWFALMTRALSHQGTRPPTLALGKPRRPPVTDPRLTSLMRKGLCFRCELPGHLARDCTNAKKA